MHISEQALIWAVISFIIWFTYRILRLILSLVMIAIPLTGLLIIGAGIYYYPENVLDAIENAIGVDPDDSLKPMPLEEVDRGSVLT